MPERRLLFSSPIIPVTQNIGKFYISSMLATQLEGITQYDVRRLVESDTEVEKYLGIQRQVSLDRVKAISQYVKTKDSTFPTSIVIAIADNRSIEISADERNVDFYAVPETDEGEAIPQAQLARILDGQHRLAGIRESGEDPELAVTIFPALDIADQAYIFATVNLAQTKVNKSLVYDLFAYARTRSPQKTCHNVAVTLNRAEKSPFYKRIKRLGKATPGVNGETLTQQQFVEGLMPFITQNPVEDRDLLIRGQALKKADSLQFAKTPFRNLFIDDRDEIIANIVWSYFDSVKYRWQDAWSSVKGQMLLRTNGFRAFITLLGPAYIALGGNANGSRQPSQNDYAQIWNLVSLQSDDFNTERFLPGSSGEHALYEKLLFALDMYKMNH